MVLMALRLGRREGRLLVGGRVQAAAIGGVGREGVCVCEDNDYFVQGSFFLIS